MAQADGVKVDDRCRRREVHIQRRDVLLLCRIKIIHSNTYATLVTGLSGDNHGILEHLAGETGAGVQPVRFDEDLLAGSGLHTDGLEIELCEVRFAPVILRVGADNDGLAPAVGDAGALGAGHLDHELIRAGLVFDATEDDELRGNLHIGVGNVGDGDHGYRRVRNHNLAGHHPVCVQTDVQVDSCQLGFLPEDRLAGGVLSQTLPLFHLGIRQCLVRFGDLGKRSPADYLGGSGLPCRPGPDRKDATAADLSGRNTLCGTGKAPESNGRKGDHSFGLG